MRAHRSFFEGDVLLPGVFRDHGGDMSTDWSSYSTPNETQNRAPKPWLNSVLAFAAGVPRELGLVVKHSPTRKYKNRAHTSVIGDKKAPRVRLKLLRRTTVVIRHAPIQ